MFFRKSRLLVGIAVAATALFGQDKPKEWIDRAEYELVAEQIAKATDPAKKLELLNQWKQKYPKTNFGWERLGAFLMTYQQTGKAKEMFETAKEMAAADPKNVSGPFYITALVMSMRSTDPAVLEEGEKAANTLLSNLDEYFGAAKKPAGIADAAWAKQKTDAQMQALNVLLYTAQVKKDWPLVETRIGDILKVTPKNAMLTYQLGTAILAQKKQERQVFAIWHFARACGLDGEGAAPPADKVKVCDYFGRVYPQVRGDTKGMEELKAKAVANVFPPTDFAIKTKQQGMIEELEELKKTNPQLAIWVQMKQALTATDGMNYFEMVKGTELPKFKGKVVSMDPPTNPKKIVVGISDASAAELTIEIEEKGFLPGKVEPGTELEFQGVAKEFVADPFNLMVTAEKEKITGWTGVATKGATTKKTVVRKKGK